MKSFAFVLCFVAVYCESSYRVAVTNVPGVDLSVDNYDAFIQEAAKRDVGILVLPSPHVSRVDESASNPDNYDATVKTLSKSAKQNGLFVVAHLYEKTRCQNKNEIIRNSLVFNNDGDIVSVYRKPLAPISSCNLTHTSFPAFTSHGITFTLVMEEDLVLQQPAGELVVTGNWSSEVAAMSAAQFLPSYAYSTQQTVISSHGIFAGRAGDVSNKHGVLSIADMPVEGLESSPPQVASSGSEDLSHFTIKSFDLNSAAKGVSDAVCHERFCCEFYIKTGKVDPKQPSTFSLAAFDGTRHFANHRHVGTQSCAVFLCTHTYEGRCHFGTENTTSIAFEKLSITANFTNVNTAQYPNIVTNSGAKIAKESFQFNQKVTDNTKEVRIELENVKNVVSISILGRDYSKDYKGVDVDSFDFYDVLYDDLTELFDYLWIRIRILIFVFSIYILEMM